MLSYSIATQVAMWLLPSASPVSKGAGHVELRT